MTTLAAWRPATAYAKGATVRPNAAQSSAPVPIANGDFDSGDTAWTKDAGWAINTGDSYEGTHKGEFTGAGSGTIKTSGTYPATPGQVITATVKARVSDAADGATALLLWYDASNVLISTSTGLESSVETGVWMQLEVAGVGPDGAAFVVFAVEATRTVGTNVLIDDARWDYSAQVEARRLVYRAVQDSAGVSGVGEPTWPTTVGARVNDGTVIWETVEASWIEWTAQPVIESGVSEPVWPTTVGAFVRDGTANWECVSRRVEDENCPNTKTVCIISSKVFAADKDIVRFCATAMPLDWSSERDAGYLPTGLQQANGNDMTVLYPYRSNLGCWNPNGFQLWQVDPDPTQMALLDQMDGIGSSHPLAACAVGNDLYFLGNAGVRSVGIASAAQNMQAGDVGMPIDLLVQAAAVQWAIDGKKALSTYWPGMGQYWICGGDDGETAGAGGALRLICAPTDGQEGNDYSYTYSATGGTAPYTFEVVSGTLPPGLELDEETGELSGMPTTAGTYSFGVQVTDALGVVAYCGWASEVVEDEVVIEPGFMLITGNDAAGGGTAYFAFANYADAPAPVAIPSSTGADLDGAASTYSGGTWAAATKTGTRYLEGELTVAATWTTGTLTATNAIEFIERGGLEWAAKELGANGGPASQVFTGSPAAFTADTPVWYDTHGDTTLVRPQMQRYINGYWYHSYPRQLLRSTTIEGPFNAVWDGYKNTEMGWPNNGAAIIGFYDGVQVGTATYFIIEWNFNVGLVRYRIWRSPDGGQSFDLDDIEWDQAASDNASPPVQLIKVGGTVVALCTNFDVITNAGGAFQRVATGLPMFPASGGASVISAWKSRRIATDGQRVYIVGGSWMVVSLDKGLTWGSPIALPLASAKSISTTFSGS